MGLIANEVVGGRFSDWLLERRQRRAWARIPVAAWLAIALSIIVLVGREALLQPGLATVVLLTAVASMDGCQLKGRWVNLAVSGVLLAAVVVYGIPLV